jgi:Ca2+-transporting ATPase
MIYITAVHVPVAGLALLPILLGLPPMLYPMHLVLLELLIDPMCALVFENEPGDPGAMSKPPRSRDEPLFGVEQIALAGLQGLVLLVATLGLYAWMNGIGSGAEAARSASFITLVTGHLSLALSVSGLTGGRVLSRERALFWAIGAAAMLVLTLSISLPVMRGILRFSPLPTWALLACVVTGILAGGWHAVIAWLHSRTIAAAARP